MEYLMMALTIGLGIALGSILLMVAYLGLASTKFGTRLIAKWFSKYLKNFNEVAEEFDFEL